jgi:hypothetical protein
MSSNELVQPKDNTRVICQLGRIIGMPTRSLSVVPKACSPRPRQRDPNENSRNGVEALLRSVGFDTAFESEIQAQLLMKASYRLVSALRENRTISAAQEVELRTETDAGLCFLEKDPSNLELGLHRVVFVEVAEISRSDGRVLLEVGTWQPGGKIKATVRLPGHKRQMKTDKFAFIKDTMKDVIRFEDENLHLRWGGHSEHTIRGQSLTFQEVPTTYYRTVHSAKLPRNPARRVPVDKGWATLGLFGAEKARMMKQLQREEDLAMAEPMDPPLESMELIKPYKMSFMGNVEEAPVVMQNKTLHCTESNVHRTSSKTSFYAE